MRYMILGGNGVFGVHTAIHLLNQDDIKRVVCIGRNSEKPEPFSLNVGHDDRRYSYKQAHITHEQDRLFEIIEDERPDVIVNFAAQGEGAVSWSKSWRFFETNCVALAQIVEHLIDTKYPGRWIQIGTSELYGSNEKAVAEDAPLNCTSPYSASKAAADMHLISMHRVKNFAMNIIRPCNAYAPGQQLHRIIPRAVVCGLSGEKLPLNGGGVAAKSYIHALDLAKAIELVAKNADIGKVYNAGANQPTQIRVLAELVAESINIKFDELCSIYPPRPGEDSVYWLDSSAIYRDVGWGPKIGLIKGIDGMVTWGRRYLKQLSQAPQIYVLRA